MAWAVRGLIEGFYGPPWTWDERLLVCRAAAARGMTHYVYAPKDDPLHRDRWREPYGAEALDGFRRLLAGAGLAVGFGISPGLDIDPRDEGDRAALAAKVDSIVALGVSLVVLALDDLPADPRGVAAQGADHGLLTTWLHDHLAGRADVALIPTDYVGTTPSPYLDALAPGVPDDVMVGWTGRHVVNDRITADDARRRSAALGGRPPLLWDNYPVNDGLMADRLFLGPLRGRDVELGDVCGGYLANAMVQPRASVLPLASAAAYLAGSDPEAGWRDAAGAQAVFAEACDGTVPNDLVTALIQVIDSPEWLAAAGALATWLDAAATCTAPGLEGEVDGWIEQVHREARLALSAVRLLAAHRPSAVVDAEGRGRVLAADPDAALSEAFAVSSRWPKVRRSELAAFGVRCGFRPVLDQWPNGQWRFSPASVTHDANATDRLIGAVLASLAEGEGDPAEDAGAAVEVTADGIAVEVAGDGTFSVSPTASVVVTSGHRRTGVPIPTAAIDRR